MIGRGERATLLRKARNSTKFVVALLYRSVSFSRGVRLFAFSVRAVEYDARIRRGACIFLV